MERTEKKFTPLQLGKTAGEAVLRLLYPPRCILCDTILVKGEEGCCRACAKKLPKVEGPTCFQCGKPVGSWETEYCDDCLRTRHWFDQGQPPSFIPVPCGALFIG